MTPATIKLFLLRGDAKSLRIAEIINWTGIAVAAPRTELDALLAREELEKTGIYILLAAILLPMHRERTSVRRKSFATDSSNTRQRSFGSRRLFLLAKTRISLRHM